MQTERYGVAKRENNAKRSFMVINRKQAKLVPSSPTEALEQFHKLAEKVRPTLREKKVLVIGFAESATAIGTALAAELGAWCINTTREPVSEPVILFSEDHSHASGQQILQEPFLNILPQIDHILFAEDEITTGKTICNCIKMIREVTDKELTFSAASFIRARNEASDSGFRKLGLEIVSLEQIETECFHDIVSKTEGNGEYYTGNAADNRIRICSVPARFSVRGLTNGMRCREKCLLFSEQISSLPEIQEILPPMKNAGILVMATEEYMYPVILFGANLEKLGYSVECQAVSRSPLLVDPDPDYPLRSRYALHSFYETDRNVFLYNLTRHDSVIVMTDAQNIPERNISELSDILQMTGHSKNVLIQCK